MEQDNVGKVKKALESFQKIDRKNIYYKPSRWYSIFAYAKLGDTLESTRILDSLVHIRYFRKGKVMELSDSIGKIEKLN